MFSARSHLPVGEIKRARDHDHDTRRQRERLRQQSAGGNRVGRNEHVGDEINAKIEHIARPARKHFRNLEPTRDGAVDAIDDERNA